MKDYNREEQKSFSLVKLWRCYDSGQYKTNFISIFETILCVILFWWLTLHYQSWWFLWSSVFVAPIFLLRSEASIAVAIDWYRNGLPLLRQKSLICDDVYVNEKTEYCVNLWGALSGFIIGSSFGYVISINYISNNVIYNSFLLSIIAEIFIISASGAVFLIVLKFIFGGSRVITVVATLSNAIISAFSSIIVIGYNSGLSSFLGSFTLFIFLFAMGGLSFPSFTAGIFIIALIVRIGATASEIFEGLKEIPNNILWVSSRLRLFGAPELMPGIDENSKLSFKGVLSTISDNFKSNSHYDKLFSLFLSVSLIFWFSPSVLYRAILKSTMWIWWIMYYLGGSPNLSDGIAGLRKDIYVKISAWSLLAFSGAGLILFMLPRVFLPFVANLRSDEPIFAVVAMFQGIKWDTISLYEWISLISTALSFALMVWVNSLWSDAQPDTPSRHKHVEELLPKVAVLAKVRLFFSVVSITLLATYLGFYANRQWWYIPVNPVLERAIGGIFGAKYVAGLMVPPRHLSPPSTSPP